MVAAHNFPYADYASLGLSLFLRIMSNSLNGERLTDSSCMQAWYTQLHNGSEKINL